MNMAGTEMSRGSLVVAAAVGGVCGGLAAVLATRELPKLLSEMKTHMHEICDEKCGCRQEEAESPGEDADPCCD